MRTLGKILIAITAVLFFSASGCAAYVKWSYKTGYIVWPVDMTKDGN